SCRAHHLRPGVRDSKRDATRKAAVSAYLERVVIAAARGNGRRDCAIPRYGAVKTPRQSGPGCRVLVLSLGMGAVRDFIWVVLLNQMTAQVPHVRDVDHCTQPQLPLDSETVPIDARNSVVRVKCRCITWIYQLMA